MEDDMIRNLVDEKKRLSVQEISKVLNILPSTVHKHLKKMGMVNWKYRCHNNSPNEII